MSPAIVSHQIINTIRTEQKELKKLKPTTPSAKEIVDALTDYTYRIEEKIDLLEILNTKLYSNEIFCDKFEALYNFIHDINFTILIQQKNDLHSISKNTKEFIEHMDYLFLEVKAQFQHKKRLLNEKIPINPSTVRALEIDKIVPVKNNDVLFRHLLGYIGILIKKTRSTMGSLLRNLYIVSLLKSLRQQKVLAESLQYSYNQKENFFKEKYNIKRIPQEIGNFIENPKVEVLIKKEIQKQNWPKLLENEAEKLKGITEIVDQKIKYEQLNLNKINLALNLTKRFN